MPTPVAITARPDHTADACTLDEGCITCGDVAVELTVVGTVDGTGSDARCRDDDGREETVAVELVGPVAVGDRILVHAGVAIERLGRTGSAATSDVTAADAAASSPPDPQGPAGSHHSPATPTRGRPDALRR